MLCINRFNIHDFDDSKVIEVTHGMIEFEVIEFWGNSGI